MDYLIVLMLFIAPVLQLVLSYYRARHKIIIPIALTGILALALSAGLCYWAQYLTDPTALNFDDKLAPPASLLFYGLLMNGISIPLITLIFTIAYYIKRERVMKRKRKAARASSATA